MLSLEQRLTSLSVSVLKALPGAEYATIENTLHGDDWIVQTNLLAIDIGRVVHVGSLCEPFEPRYLTLPTVDIVTKPQLILSPSHYLEWVDDLLC